MQGIDIARKFYFEHGEKMLKVEFPSLFPRLSIGLVGEGSECFKFDDEISIDHDFEPGFCIFITKEDYEKFGFKLERAYAKLPKEFLGLKRSILSPTGGNRHGVIIANDFYQKFLGVNEIPNDNLWWLYTPSHSLATACNGEIFVDNLKEFSKNREILLKGYPEEIRIKKIAGHLLLMAQSGQYNYSRLVERKETGASQLAIFEFVKHTISVIYLLNNAFEPFYKWCYKGMRNLKILSELEPTLSTITELGNSKKEFEQKIEIIELVAKMVIEELKKQNLTSATCFNLETHAYSVNDKIKDGILRNLHILEGI